ncbi:MAG: peptide ABC transporter permease, partial [Dokdonella sp.]
MEIRPILSALMRSKVSMILIGVQVALTLAIVCNALFIIGQRLEHMGRPSGMNEADTFYFGSGGFGQ